MSIIIPANSAVGGGYAVDNSCRFDGTAAYLNRTQGTSTNLTKFAWSGWIKRSKLGADQTVTMNYASASNYGYFYFRSGDDIRIFDRGAGGDTVAISDMLFRDTSAWYHIALIIDTTQATDTNRLKLYVNGILQGLNGVTYPVENAALGWKVANTSNTFLMRTNSADGYVGGYLAEVAYVDGTANAITDFGEFDSDSGVWKPIDVSGLTFGNEGYYVDFEDSANLGNDASGGTDFTENSLAAIDQTTDTCTNNFCTINPLWRANQTLTFSEGNTKGVGVSAHRPNNSTFAPSAGKWYMEGKLISGSSNKWWMGYADQQWIDSNQNLASGTNMDWGGGNIAGGTNQRNVSLNNGWSNQLNLYPNSAITSFFSSSSVANDIIAMAVDLDNQKAWWSQNGVWRNGSATASTTFNASYPDTTQLDAGRNYYIATGSENSTWLVNYGNPAYAITSSNADGNGYGNFEYEVPSGFFSLCTKNLSEVLS